MNIMDAFKLFFFAMSGIKPSGKNISEVIRSGTARMNIVNYGDSAKKSIVLNSSTTDSEKQFSITVDDTGALTATEITE